MKVISSELNIYYQNIRSIKNKESDFREIICSETYHIICLTETWLSEETLGILDLPVSLGWKYTLYSRPTCQRGGGVLVLICPQLSLSYEYTSSLYELVVIVVNIPSPLCLAVLYNPPPSDNTDWDAIFDECRAANIPDMPWIFLGDFNLPSWNKTPLSNNLLTSTLEHNLSQIIPFPTRGENYLDLIFTRLITTSKIRNNNCFKSDHLGVEFEVMNIPPIAQIKAHRMVRDYYRTNWLRLNHLILDLTNSFNVIGEPTPVVIDDTIDNLINLIEAAIPKKKISGNSLPWMDSDLLALCKKKNRFHKIWKIRRSEMAYRNYSEIRTSFKSELSKKRNAFFLKNQKLYQTDSKKFWRIFKPNSVPNFNTISTKLQSKDFAKHFALLSNENRIFSPLPDPVISPGPKDLQSIQITSSMIKDIVHSSSFQTKSSPDILNGRVLRCCAVSLIPFFEIIMSASSSLGYYPRAWKKSSIFPLHKKGDKSDVRNYRQITIQPLMGKIFDKIIYLNIYPHVLPLIQDYAHYGIKGRSINSNLICTTAFLLESFEKNKVIDVLYADIEKAFDNVSIYFLLFKLEHQFGFKGVLLDLFKSFFTERTSFVNFNDDSSASFTVSKGIPQGGILSPLLFVLFTNDIPCNTDCRILTYADDVKLLSARSSNSSPAPSLQIAIDDLSAWTTKWGLSLNPDKSKIMTFTLKKGRVQTDDLPILNINGSRIEIVDTFTDLGVTFDPALTFSSHIVNLNMKLRKSLGFLKYNYKLITDLQTRKILYNAFFQAKMDFGLSIWAIACQTNISYIEKTHNRVIKQFILRRPSDDYYKSCKDSGILPIQLRAKTIAVPLLCSTLIPLSSFLTPIKTITRTSMVTRTVQPYVIPKVRLSISQRSLRVSLPLFLNSLPSDYLPTIPFHPLWKKRIKDYILEGL